MLRPLDLNLLRSQFSVADPFPHVLIENFLEPNAAREVASSYPSFDMALAQGVEFNAVNEKKKIQITDVTQFPPPVARLNLELASSHFLKDLSYITNIPNLLADSELVGGGMHITGPGGRLDVHLDFNYMEERKLHRRLNLLLYLNDNWHGPWGGNIQFWDPEVRKCLASFEPLFNRCVIFETNEISYHGVVPVSPTALHPRISFATYYYTREAPAHWTGEVHSTIFRARPEEKMRGMVMMPAESLSRRIKAGVRNIKRTIKQLVPK